MGVPGGSTKAATGESSFRVIHNLTAGQRIYYNAHGERLIPRVFSPPYRLAVVGPNTAALPQ